MRPSFRHMWLEREGGGFDTINQCLVDPWVQQLANESWELFASRVDTQTGSESFCGICWTLVWENYDSNVGWDIKQPRWEADETVFSGVEYLLLRSWISCWQPASHLCHHPDFCAKQIWQKTPREFAHIAVSIVKSNEVEFLKFGHCLPHEISDELLGVNFCTK